MIFAVLPFFYAGSKQGRGQYRTNRFNKIVTYLKTAFVNAWADCTADVLYSSTVVAHNLYGFSRNTVHRSPPSGMSRTDHARLGIKEEQGTAVCRFDEKRNSFFVCYKTVERKI